ncbi:hypothetical protein K439DRAFT_1641184 [Ramaria rubella]|nr:hypothetical protein K439DRAFT_1641184 [Ramaria rubella]
MKQSKVPDVFCSLEVLFFIILGAFAFAIPLRTTPSKCDMWLMSVKHKPCILFITFLHLQIPQSHSPH